MSQHVKVHEFLKHHPMGVLSTVSAEGEPWGSAIYYVADDDFTFYFVTRANTQKYQNIADKPLVALTIADEADQTTVQMQGTISKVSSDDIIDIAFNKLGKIKPGKDPDWMPPIYKVHAGDYMVLQIRPVKLHYADYKQASSDVAKNYIEQIIPAA